MYEVPTPSDVPELELGQFTYTYHCCAFESHAQAEHITFSIGAPDISPQLSTDVVDVDMFTPSPANLDELCKLFAQIALYIPICQSDNDSPAEILNQREIVFVATNDRRIPERRNKFHCYPYSDEPMKPCKDLFGSWIFRILVWLLFIIILFGNGIVLALILKLVCGSGSYDGRNQIIPYLFIFQLAIADIGIGIYLGFLVAVDLKTFSQHSFYELALSWQNGPSCLAAGFIAIFSSELCVYTLVVITLERLYVHTCGLSQIKVCNVIILLMIGWLFAATCATLPLTGYNSYSSVAVCLPLDVVSTKGRFYIAVLIGLNLLAFLFLSGCNFYIFLRVWWRSTTTSNRKMACMVIILAFIDFICWAPLLVLSLAALSYQDLINTNTAKWFAVVVLPMSACANPLIYMLLSEKVRRQILCVYRSIKRALFASQQVQLQQENSTEFEDLGKPGSYAASSGPLSNDINKETMLDEKISSGNLPSVSNPMFTEDHANNSPSLLSASPFHDTGEEDSTSITSFSVDATSVAATDNCGYNQQPADAHSLKSSQLLIEETDI